MPRRTVYVVGRSAETRARIRAALAATDVEIRSITGRLPDQVTALAQAPGDLVVVEDSPSRGLDALTFVENLRNNARVAVVAVGTRADPERVQALLRAGASACVIGDDTEGWQNVAPLLREKKPTRGPTG
jgi:DNA-binding NarL/FixJ family response regulator